MLIQHKLTGNKGMFFVQPEEEVLAEMIYLQHDPNTMIIEHTEVNDELKGQNVGLQLVEAAVEYARSHNIKVIPMCSFAKAVIDNKPEFQDVLKEGEF